MSSFKITKRHQKEYIPLDIHGMDTSIDNRNPKSFTSNEINFMLDITGFRKKPGKVLKTGECIICNKFGRQLYRRLIQPTPHTPAAYGEYECRCVICLAKLYISYIIWLWNIVHI